MGRKLTVAVAQFAADQDPSRNRERGFELVRQAAAQGAHVVCLQELFTSRYFCQAEVHDRFDLAEPIPGPTTQAACDLARQCGVAIVCPLFEKAGPGIYFNSAVLIDCAGRIALHYRKLHVPDDPLYYEKFYFCPGDRGVPVARVHGAKVSVLICWDQWFPEAARLAALHGAEVVFFPTAIGWHDHERKAYGATQLDAWITVQRSHAIANGIFVAAANRVGREGTVQFWGNSFICAPFGRMLVRASEDTEGVWVAECDMDEVDEVRRHWPFFRDRRIDVYGPLLKRYVAEPEELG